MPKCLQYYIGGEGSLRTPKNDYVICARSLYQTSAIVFLIVLQLIGGFAALLSVFILAMPVPIIVNRLHDDGSKYFDSSIDNGKGRIPPRIGGIFGKNPKTAFDPPSLIFGNLCCKFFIMDIVAFMQGGIGQIVSVNIS